MKGDLAKIELKKERDDERVRLARPGLHRHLSIFDVIYGGNVDTWIEVLEHWERRDPGKPITIRINSPGGSVFDGFALFDTILRLRRKGHHVTTHGTGMVASMAAILMQAGDERVLDPNAYYMIHEIATSTQGKASELADTMKLLRRLEDRANNILAERSILTVAQIKRRQKKTDDYMDAEEALKLGFVDRVE